MMTWLTGLRSSLESFFLQRQDWMLLLTGDSQHAQAVVPVLEHLGAEWSDLEILVRVEPYAAPESYVDALIRGIVADWEQMRAWVQLEGGEVPEALEEGSGEAPPVQRLHRFLSSLRLGVLSAGITRLGLALIPAQVVSELEWHRFLRELLVPSAQLPEWSGSRLIVWTGGRLPLAPPSPSSAHVQLPALEPSVWSGSLQLVLSGMQSCVEGELERDEALAPDEASKQHMRLVRAATLLSHGQLESGFALLESIREGADLELRAMAGLVGGQHRLRLGQAEVAGQQFLWGIQRAGEAGNVELAEECLDGLIRCGDALGRAEESLPLLKQLLVLCSQTGHVERQGAVLERLCRLYGGRGEWEEACAAAQLGLGLPENEGGDTRRATFRAVLEERDTPEAGSRGVTAGRSV